MTVKQLRSQKSWYQIVYWTWKTIFWEVLLWVTWSWVCYLWFIDRNRKKMIQDMKDIWSYWDFIEEKKLIKNYINNIFVMNKKYDLYINWSDFDEEVWKELVKIPKWKTLTYQNIANNLKKPEAVRAVANAIWRNHIWYLIPCHRVVKKSSELWWYKWGTPRKKLILDYEKNSKHT